MGHCMGVRNGKEWVRDNLTSKYSFCLWFREYLHSPVIPAKPPEGILFLIFNRWVVSSASIRLWSNESQGLPILSKAW